MAVPLEHFLAAAQFFIVLILDAHRLADVVDAILIGRRIVTAGCFVADRVGVLPARVNVARAERQAVVGVTREFGALRAAARNRGVTQGIALTRGGGRDEAFL